MKFLSVFLLIVAFVLSAAGQEHFAKPVDEASKDASFLAFRTKLIAAAEKKDVKHIISILDPKITSSFGGHEGIADFKEFWKINDKDSRFWEEFLRVIKNGGRFDGEGRNKNRSFTAPYLFNSTLPSSCDSFDCLAIFGNNVNLREQPNTNARVITQLSYNIVKIEEEAAIKRKTGPGEWDWVYDWHKVETLGGQKGWVKAEFVRRQEDYRAGFEKKRGVWKMIFFVAGD
jgi:hypothetical protein